MPNIQDRPYVGTWRLNQRATVKYTPDALVYINGDTSVPGCGTCNGRIDIQPFVKGISVEASTLPGGHSASIQLNVPRVYGQSLFIDGKFLIRPTLEVHIYFKGWFPVSGMYDQLDPEETTILPKAGQFGGSESGANSIEGVPAYPYYHVFHGVITQVNHDYADGFYTATIACGSMLHFWQYQTVSVNGAAFGTRPRNSKVKMSMIGHNMSGMSPYGIIYLLYKDTAGAVQGVNFALSDKTNNSAVTSGGDSLYTMSMLYWERRFKQSMYSLRMHGTSGRLFNGAQQAFLGSTRTQDIKDILKGSMYADGSKTHVSRDPMGDYLTVRNKLVEAGESQEEITESVRGRTVSNSNLANIIGANAIGKDVIFSKMASENEMGLNVLDAQAFVSDVSNWGNISLWETEYETKLDIAHKVTQITGFEFFQDVDGDFVFKPPFYNMDTSDNRVYRIEDVDIINFNSMEKEPMATMVTLKSGQIKNLKISGLDGAFGKRGQFIDYRLVAQYGWRPHTMDITYFNNPRSLFYAAVNKLDLLNIDINSATLTIPVRPELRPGYPLYIPSIDSFYYVSAFSHAFQFGGQCTTTLTLTGRRSKFYAPGKKPDGEEATVNSLILDNPYLPPTPLIIKDERGLPKLSGFPNVVLALDPTRLNPKFSIPNLIRLDNISDEFVPAFEELIKAMFQSGTQIIGVSDDVVDSKESMTTGPFVFRDGDNEIKADFLADSKSFALNFQQTFEQVKALKKERAEIERQLTVRKKIKVKKQQEAAATLAALDRQIKDIFENRENALSLVTVYQANLRRNNDPEGREESTGINDPSSTAAYLDVLDDRKSNFVSDSFPGYYRYYSASHPNPLYQGMVPMFESDPTETEPAKIPSTITTGARVKTPGNVKSPKPDGDVITEEESGSGEVGLVDVTVTHGITLSGPRGSNNQVTPTNLIQTIAFSPVLVRKSTTVIGLTLVDNFNLSDKGFKVLTTAVANRILTLALAGRSLGEVEEETVLQTFVDAANQLNFITKEALRAENAKSPPQINRAEFRATGPSGEEIQDQINLGFKSDYFEVTPDIDLPQGGNLRGSAPRGVLLKKDTTTSIQDGVVQGVRLSRVTIDELYGLKKKSSDRALSRHVFKTFGKRVKKKKGEKGSRFSKKGTLQNVAMHYANFIVGNGKGNQSGSIRFELDRVLNIVIEEDRKNISHYFNEFLFQLTEAPLKFVRQGNGMGTLQKDPKLAKRIKKLTTRPTPVFPVSDENGYEVIGSYRYGRGIGVGEGGTMQAIYEDGNNLVLDVFSRIDAKTVHDFMQALSTFEVQDTAFRALSKNSQYQNSIRRANNTNLDSDERAQARSEANTQSRSALAGASLAELSKDKKNANLLADFNYSGREGTPPLEGINISPSQNAWANAFANSVVTGHEQNFKLPVVNNSHLMNDIHKDMTVNQRNMCSCRAAEADIQLEAFGKTQFISIEGDNFEDASVKFMQEQMIEKSIVWRDNKQALGGTRYQDPFAGVIDAWNRLRDAGENSGDRFVAQVETSAIAVNEALNTLSGRSS